MKHTRKKASYSETVRGQSSKNEMATCTTRIETKSPKSKQSQTSNNVKAATSYEVRVSSSGTPNAGENSGQKHVLR